MAEAEDGAGSDAALCDATYGAVELFGEEPTDDLYATVVLPWAAYGAVSNGGFEHLFSGAFFDRDPGYARTLAAFERLGAAGCAAALREAVAWLGQPVPAEPEERVRRYEAVEKAERWRVAQACWAGRPELERTLASFIRARAPELEGCKGRESRLGDLRLRREGQLVELRGVVVVRSFDLREWTADLESWPRLAPTRLQVVAVAGLLLLSVGAVALGRRWAALLLGAGAVVACAQLRLTWRVWLRLRRGDEVVRLGGWSDMTVERFSFATAAAQMSLAAAGDEDESPEP